MVDSSPRGSNAFPVIAVDGLAATGKGTIARAIATQLNWNLLDSGLLYRIVGFLVEKFHLDLEIVDEVEEFVREEVHIEYSNEGVSARSGQWKFLLPNSLLVLSDSLPQKRVHWNGKDVTPIIRSDIYSRIAAKVAASQRIRNVLIPIQRQQRTAPGLVADGRDMGTVIFPDAELKIFLEASPETRARRRMAQLGVTDTEENYLEFLNSLRERDSSDSLREVAPAVAAGDAVRIDTSDWTEQQTVDHVMDLVRARELPR